MEQFICLSGLVYSLFHDRRSDHDMYILIQCLQGKGGLGMS